MISIRLATESDAEVIADLSRKTFYDTFHADNSEENMNLFLEKQFSKSNLIEEALMQGNYYLLAYEEELVVGYAALKFARTAEGLHAANACELARFYIAKDKIGRGIADCLMHETLEFATANGHDVIWLGVWERNQRAIRFYQKWAFEAFGKHGFLLGNDLQTDLLMKKRLNENVV